MTIHFEKTIPQMWFAGRVFEADGATPAAGEIVGIFAPAEEQDSAASAYLAPPVTSSSAARCRTRIAEAHTNEEGIFQSPRLRPGATSRAWSAARASRSWPRLSCAPGKRRPSRASSSRAARSSRGASRGWRGARSRGRAFAPGSSMPTIAFAAISRALAPLEAEASVAADGAYRVGPLPPGASASPDSWGWRTARARHTRHRWQSRRGPRFRSEALAGR